jgi:lantibiotic modifying enzyme
MKNINKKIRLILDALQKYHNNNDIGLFTGGAGVSLFELIVAKQNKDGFIENAAIERIENMFDIIEQDTNLSSTFCSGLAGLLWSFNFLERQQILEIETSLNDQAEFYLENKYSQYLQLNYWDFLHGAIGICFSLILNKEKSDIIKHTEPLIELLNNTKEVLGENTIAWKSIIYAEKQHVVYNLSLSHGISSIIMFLIRIFKYHNVDKQKEILTILEHAVNFILSKEMNVEKYGSFYPTYIPIDKEVVIPSRLSWCYGDLGISTTLYQAGKSINRQCWIDKAIEVLLYAAEKRRDLEKNAVVDAGLCHGTAGIGHIFYRMWWDTRLPEFKNAAEYWFQETLKMGDFENDIIGYKVWYGKKHEWRHEYGLLEGIAGIGLALFTYSFEMEPAWDQCLLLS